NISVIWSRFRGICREVDHACESDCARFGLDRSPAAHPIAISCRAHRLPSTAEIQLPGRIRCEMPQNATSPAGQNSVSFAPYYYDLLESNGVVEPDCGYRFPLSGATDRWILRRGVDHWLRFLVLLGCANASDSSPCAWRQSRCPDPLRTLSRTDGRHCDQDEVLRCLLCVKGLPCRARRSQD